MKGAIVRKEQHKTTQKVPQQKQRQQPEIRNNETLREQHEQQGQHEKAT